VLTVYIAEDLNEYLSKNYKAFTRHQYFDSSGLFISLFMSLPLLLASAFIVVSIFDIFFIVLKEFGVNLEFFCFFHVFSYLDKVLSPRFLEIYLCLGSYSKVMKNRTF
jgi:hypothetical protein